MEPRPKSQGTVARHLRYCDILMKIYCKFTVESAYERICKISQHLAKL